MDVDAEQAQTVRSRLVTWAMRWRFPLSAAADSSFVAVSIAAAALFRFEFEFPLVVWERLAAFVVVAVAAHLALAMIEGLYMGVARFASFDELAGLARAVLGGTLLSALLNRFFLDRLVPVSVSLAYGAGAFILMCALRYLWRLQLERRRRPDQERAQKVVVYGAGEGGHQIITAMLRNPDSRYYPVALLDDDRTKSQLRISNVRVEGPLDALPDLADRTDAEAVIIAIPSAEPGLVRRVDETARECGLRVLILPPVDELLGSHIRVSDIRPVTEEDLLGRGHVDTDMDSIAGYLTGKRVLVTGAGGSIGSELCRQIHRFYPAELVMLDRDESLLHAVQLSIDGRGQLDSRALVVADIRDQNRIIEVFEQHRPEVVFHAAALKHLTLLERFPDEGVKTNVFGTLHVLEAARRVGVERFVNISTDKAADPTSMLGYTKRIAERLTAAVAQETDGTYLSVRFGNVLGSRGSVLTSFRWQIEAGGPVTVTHPDVTRYFMTVEEAVQLVIQAGAVGGDGEALILDMGEPVKIDDVAKRMIEASGQPIKITYTGLRQGEKLHEVLRAESEPDHRPHHDLISHVCVPPLPIERIEGSSAQTVVEMAEPLSQTNPDAPRLTGSQ